jgi:hypothetical protein
MREKWIEYMDEKKVVFLTKLVGRKSAGNKYFSYGVTVPIEWARKFKGGEKIRVTVEVIE